MEIRKEKREKNYKKSKKFTQKPRLAELSRAEAVRVATETAPPEGKGKGKEKGKGGKWVMHEKGTKEGSICFGGVRLGLSKHDVVSQWDISDVWSRAGE